MNTFGPNFFDFHAWVKKCHFGNLLEFSKVAQSSIPVPYKSPTAELLYNYFAWNLVLPSLSIGELFTNENVATILKIVEIDDVPIFLFAKLAKGELISE